MHILKCQTHNIEKIVLKLFSKIIIEYVIREYMNVNLWLKICEICGYNKHIYFDNFYVNTNKSKCVK